VEWKLGEIVYKLLIKFQHQTDLETLSDLLACREMRLILSTGVTIAFQ
jgi:hypothetical protein